MDNPTGPSQTNPSAHARHNINRPKYLAFDLEIAKVIPGDFNDWRSHRPIGISCAATVIQGEKPILWFSRSADGSYSKQLIQTDAAKLAEYLQGAAREGLQILTWNGLGFDFDVLSEESGRIEICRDLAFNHIDMMFQIFCLKGYPLALNKAAIGMGLPGKIEGMTGDQAPILWQQGQYDQVLEYVARDAQVTLNLACAVDQCGNIRWKSNVGKPQSITLPNGWLSVRNALNLPEPDTAWMSSPLKRKDFLNWL